MSKITDALDAAGEGSGSATPGPVEAVATSDAAATRSVAARLAEGSSGKEALEEARGTLGLDAGDPLLFAEPADGVAGVAVPGAAEGSYRGHPVFAPDEEGGHDLLQALALLDALPLSDLGASERARWIAHAAAVASAEGREGRPLEARLDVDHLEALLDAPTPPRPVPDEAPPVLAAALDRVGGAAVRTHAGGLPLLLLRSDRPFLAAAVGGDSLPGALALVTQLLDGRRPLDEAADVGPGAAVAAVLIEDDLGRAAVVSGCPEGAHQVGQALQAAGTTSRQS